ncbi:MAG: NADH-quinone oxidoreductase subunit A, partial [Candidatus Zixiibacteriota bacterium]
MFETFYPILFLLIFSGLLAGVLVSLSIFIGRRTKLGKKGNPYECGVEPVGTTKDPIQVKFYLVAILFIVFDIEVVFLYPWAIIARKLGVFGLVE